VVSGVILSLWALVGFHGGRATSLTEMYDPNELAYLLVSVLPLGLAFAMTAKSKAIWLLNSGVSGLMVIVLLLTGSRGGFLGLLAVLALLVTWPIKPPDLRPQAVRKRRRVIPALLGVLCLSLIVWPYLPAETRHRLATVITLEGDYNLDTTNQQGRTSIWERNFTAALHRPIGYGARSFEIVDMRTGGRYMAPHNSYLQALVELGFIGAFLFIRVYALSWSVLQRGRRVLLVTAAEGERDEVLVFARLLQISLIGNAVAGFFLSMAYSTVLWVLVTLALAFTFRIPAVPGSASPLPQASTT
jgi:putative inorganic carbon (hco3(-)) transporter